MSVFRLLKWVGISLILVLFTAVLYLGFADLNWLKPHIESAVANATGRELKLAGRIDLDILPSPAILLEDVSLSNADWGSEPMLATIGHFSIRFNLWPSASGAVKVRELRLRDVDVLLETNAQDEANWLVGSDRPAEQPGTGAATGGGVPLIIEFAEIRNINISYRSPGAEPFVASLASLDINTDEDGYTLLDGKGEVNTLPLQLGGKLGPAQALISGEQMGIDMNASLGNATFTLDGSVEDLAKPGGIDLKAVVNSDDVAPILERLGVRLPLTGELNVETAMNSVEQGTRLSIDARAGEIAASVTATRSVEAMDFELKVPALDKVGRLLEIQGLPAEDLTAGGRVVIDPQVFSLQGISARLDKAEVKLDGTVDRGTDAAAEFFIKANGPSLAAFSSELPGIPFKADLTASLTPEQLVLDEIKASFGESDLSGSVAVTMGEKTTINGKLNSQRLDLTPFAADSEAVTNERKPTAHTRHSSDQGQYLFVEDPLPFDELGKTDIDFNTSISRLTLNDIVLLDVATSVDLKDGKAHYRNRFTGPAGGRGVSDVALSIDGETAVLEMKVNMRDLRLNLVSGDVKDPTLIPPVDMTLDIKSSGGSPRTLASSANGRVLVTQGKGKIRNDLVAKVSGDVFTELFSALNPFAKNEAYTTLDCTIFGLDIVNGDADIAGMFSQGEKIQVVGDGNINLNDEALNIEFNTKPRKGVGVSVDMFVTPFVKLTGTLVSPRIGLDKKGTLLAVGSAGLSVLAKAVADRATGGKDRCAEILAEVGDHPPMKDQDRRSRLPPG